MSTKNFGVGANESYPKRIFLQQLTDGEVHWEARMVLFDFFYAYECGYIKNFYPSPGFSLDEEIVDKCIKKLDFEWQKETTARAGKVYNKSPKFEVILESPQKLALIECLLSIMPNWFTNILAQEKDELERKQQSRDYFND